jgi:asparagine synthase (glutamine-hydrolysing)
VTPPARVATPIVAVIALTAEARERITAQGLEPLSELWHRDSSSWSIDREAALAILDPEVALQSSTGQQAMLTIRGRVLAGGQSVPPTGWPVPPHDAGPAGILYDIIERDVRAIDSLRGQFALVAWDGRRRRLLAARDHAGQRCLFTRVVDGMLLLCSELAPLLRLGGGCTLDHEAAFWYLAFGMPPPGRTLASEVDRIPAAHALHWEPGNQPTVVRFWTPLRTEAPVDAGPEVVAELRSALDSAMERVLREGPRLGLLLSGGVDSSYLAATAVGMGVKDVHALTASFEPESGMNETEYAAAVAVWLGLEHEVVHLEAPAAADLLGQVVLCAAEPCSAWATLTHFALLARARQLEVERIISGLGADEVMGGYDHARGYYSRFLRHGARAGLAGIPDHFECVLADESRGASRVLYPGVARFFGDTSLRAALSPPYRNWNYASYLRSFYRECRRLKPGAHYMEMAVAHELQHRIPDLLFAGFEPVSRRLGIDMHYPFVDPDVVTLAAGLGAESRYRTAKGEFSLRRRALHPRFKHAMLLTAADRVPEQIRLRPRKSLTAPFGAWMFHPPFAEAVLARLRSSGLWDERIVRIDWLEYVVARLEPRPNEWAFQLWALITLAGWYDRFAHRH